MVPRFVFQIWIQYPGRPSGVPLQFKTQMEDVKTKFEEIGFEYKLFTDADVLDILHAVPTAWSDAYLSIKKHYVVRTDLLRLFILYIRGGLYLDADVSVVGDLSTLQFCESNTTKFVKSSRVLQNFIVYSSGNDPTLRKFIESACKRVSTLNFLRTIPIRFVMSQGILWTAGPLAIAFHFRGKMSQHAIDPAFSSLFKHEFADTWHTGLEMKRIIVLAIVAMLLLKFAKGQNKKREERRVI